MVIHKVGSMTPARVDARVASITFTDNLNVPTERPTPLKWQPMVELRNITRPLGRKSPIVSAKS
jgi:hypothetical protein